MTTKQNTAVIAGPAGHWYALDGDTLVGLPQMADEDLSKPPAHPSEMEDPWVGGGWYEITDPAPECDDAKIIAELRAKEAGSTAAADTDTTNVALTYEERQILLDALADIDAQMFGVDEAALVKLEKKLG